MNSFNPLHSPFHSSLLALPNQVQFPNTQDHQLLSSFTLHAPRMPHHRKIPSNQFRSHPTHNCYTVRRLVSRWSVQALFNQIQEASSKSVQHVDFSAAEEASQKAVFLLNNRRPTCQATGTWNSFSCPLAATRTSTTCLQIMLNSHIKSPHPVNLMCLPIVMSTRSFSACTEKLQQIFWQQGPLSSRWRFLSLWSSCQSINDMPVDGNQFLELFVELHVALFCSEATQRLCQLLRLQCFLQLVKVTLAFLQNTHTYICSTSI